MDWFKKLIYDPSWWVTAVFVGLIVSVIAGFLKDAISRMLASSSERFRVWRAAHRAAFLHKADLMAREFSFILYTRINAVAMLVIWSTLLLLMLAAYILSKFSEASHQTSLIGLVAAGVLQFFPYFIAVRLLRLSREARRIYLRRQSLAAKQTSGG